MGYRLSKIITKTGDKGETGLGDGSRVSKASLRVDAMGDVDELNACVGLLLAQDMHSALLTSLSPISHHLFDLGSELAVPSYHAVKVEHINWLEELAGHLITHLTPLDEFILPGGSVAASHCHVARTVCRRAERKVVALAEVEDVSPFGIQYLNRLSDVLFILARYLNKEASVPDILWQKNEF